MVQRIQILRGTTAEWAADDIVLLLGELGTDTTTGIVKIGDGTSTWSALDGTTLLPATTTAVGGVELSTDAETIAGTDTERAVTPSGLDAASTSTMFSGQYVSLPAVEGTVGQAVKIASLAPLVTEWGDAAGGGAETWRQMLWPINPFAVTGTWNVLPATTTNFNVRTDGAPHVQNDSIEWKCDMSAGTWKFEMNFLGISSGGIATVSIDGTSVGTIDTYLASSTNNVTALITGVSIGTSGVKTVKITMATKNASSTGYRCYFTYLSAQRTA